MNNFHQKGQVLDLAPGADVASGVGYLFGAALFGVAATDVASGATGSFITEGVVTIAKTSALAISVGDVLYWAPGSSVVNKTTSGQRAVGVAVEAAANPSATVKMKLGVPTQAGT
jgi:predicted RecA/RadA family phage recombinase